MEHILHVSAYWPAFWRTGLLSAQDCLEIHQYSMARQRNVEGTCGRGFGLGPALDGVSGPIQTEK